MRAIEYTETGAPDVLTLTDRPVPEPGPGEVRVRVHRSGVNPTDWKTRTGSAPGTPVDPPQVPNQDGAGVVDAVGEGVEAALAGLRVWIWEAAHLRPSGGTAQEYAVVPARHVVLLPDLASYDLGASLGVPFLTAHRCLTVTEDGPQRLGPGTLQGRTVLVAGRRRRGRQRRDPARAVVRRHRAHHGQQPGEGQPGRASPAPTT